MCEQILSFHFTNPHAVIAGLKFPDAIAPEMITPLENLSVEGDVDDEGNFLANTTAIVDALQDAGKHAAAVYWVQQFRLNQIVLVRASKQDARLNYP